MVLFWHELVHILLSLIIGYFVWRKYNKPVPAFLAAFIGGVLIDLDHLFDYFLVYGWQFNLMNFLKGLHFEISNKVYVPLHAWEYIILLSVIYLILEKKFEKSKIKSKQLVLAFILALTISMYSHLIIDTITNVVVPLGYSILFRGMNNFSAIHFGVTE